MPKKNELDNLVVFRRLFLAAFGEEMDFNPDYAPRTITMKQFARLTREAMNIAIKAKETTVKAMRKSLKKRLKNLQLFKELNQAEKNGK